MQEHAEARLEHTLSGRARTTASKRIRTERIAYDSLGCHDLPSGWLVKGLPGADEILRVEREGGGAAEIGASMFASATAHDTKRISLVRTSKYPRVTTLVQEAAAHAGDAPMLVQGNRQWSYRDLSARVAELAEALLSVGHRQGETVAICATERGFDLYAGLLSVWHARGVALLIDAGLPPERRQHMLDVAGARTLLLIGKQSDSCREASLNILAVHPIEPVQDLRRDSSRPPATADDDARAYVFFTSGTTGAPKGLVGRHDSLTHFLLWQRDEFLIGPGDRCAQLTSMSADAVLRDIFTPLVSGASLCLPDDPSLTPHSGRILQWLRASGVTMIHTVPSLSTRWLADAHTVGSLEALRLVFFAGEPLPGGLVDRWRSVAPRGEIVNLYGASECTMVQAFHRIPRNSRDELHPAGRAIHNCELFLLTPSGAPSREGEVGEVHIRTAHATLGYIGEDKDHRFTRPAAGGGVDGIIFRTGDEGRWRTDGALEIQGRLADRGGFQRGSTNPDHVNGVLSRHPGVLASAVVVAADRAEGSPCLHAFVVFDPVRPTTSAHLRRYLRNRLPPAAVPTAFIPVTELPLTAVGKLDRPRLTRLITEPAPAIRHRAGSISSFSSVDGHHLS